MDLQTALGSLNDFVGGRGSGVWLLSMIDNQTGGSGILTSFNVYLTPNTLIEGEEGVRGEVGPERFAYFVIDVPVEASALRVNLTEFQPNLDLYLRHEALPTLNTYDKRALGTGPAVTLRCSTTDVPPLNPGRYFVGVYNPDQVSKTFRLTFFFERDLIVDADQPYFPDEQLIPIIDDALTTSTVFVPGRPSGFWSQSCAANRSPEII